MDGFKKMFEEVERLLKDTEYGSVNDNMSTIRLKTLAAGLRAADLMVEHPRLADACVGLLINHMELYAELVIIAQNNDIIIPSPEATMALMISNATNLGEA